MGAIIAVLWGEGFGIAVKVTIVQVRQDFKRMNLLDNRNIIDLTKLCQL